MYNSIGRNLKSAFNSSHWKLRRYNYDVKIVTENGPNILVDKYNSVYLAYVRFSWRVYGQDNITLCM